MVSPNPHRGPDPLRREGRGRRGDLHDEAIRVGDRPEVVVLVERGGRRVDRFDHDDPARALVGGADDPLERIDEQLGAQAVSVERAIEREAAEQVARRGAVAGGRCRGIQDVAR